MNVKKIVIVVTAVVVLLTAAYFYLDNRNRSLSPPGNDSLTKGNLTVTVDYSRPSVRGRLIFGPEEKGALQPYGKYWRLGANEPTKLTVSRDVTFNGNKLKKGTYRMYAIPGSEKFEIGVNSVIGRWGYSEPNYELDVIKTSVPVQRAATPVEQHTIRLQEADQGIDIIVEWSDVRLTIPVR